MKCLEIVDLGVQACLPSSLGGQGKGSQIEGKLGLQSEFESSLGKLVKRFLTRLDSLLVSVQ